MNKVTPQITPLYEAALNIVKRLQSKGYACFFVGGYVRDILLNKKSKDIDIVTSALPEEVDSIFNNTHHIGASFGIINVVEEGFNFEVATFREEREYSDGRHPEEILYTDDPKLDAIRRDFTINGMFYDPISGEILDYVEGVKDLERGIIRTIGDPEQRFNEDYLRMLRAVRFVNRFDFELATETSEAIQKNSHNVIKLSVERVRDEISKMLIGPKPAESIKMLDKLGLLEHILPEVSKLKGVKQPEKYHPEGDVFVHTMLMLENMNEPSIELAWSVLMHDIGKPATFSVGDDGIEHFYGHESVGARIAEKIMKRLHFSNKEIEAVVNATQNHMRFACVHEMRPAKWRRIIADENFDLELELHRLDCMSSNKMMGNYELMLKRMQELESEVELPKPLINGTDLVNIGMKPGPEFGKILRKVADLQLDGKITTKEQALEYVQKDYA